MNQREVFLDNEDCYTKHSTVGGDKRKEDTESLVKGWRHFLQHNLNHLNQGCDDEDERQGLQILQAKRIEHVDLQKIGDDGCQCQHESYCSSHSQGGVYFLGYSKEWADTQELRKDDIVDEYR